MASTFLAAKRWMPWWFHHQERAFKHMYQGKFDHDRTLFSRALEIMVRLQESHPQINGLP